MALKQLPVKGKFHYKLGFCFSENYDFKGLAPELSEGLLILGLLGKVEALLPPRNRQRALPFKHNVVPTRF